MSEARARRILGPVASVGRQAGTGAFLYRQTAAEQARAAGPGRGFRSDLAGKPLRHGLSGYRAHCPCAVCRGARAEQAATERHTERYGPHGPVNATVRRQVLKHIQQGRTVREAAALVGITHQAVYGAARALPRFGEQLEKATRRE